MGYSHYFKNTRPNKEFAAVARKIVDASDVEICGADGTGKPSVRATGIVLNGSKALGENYETFSVLNTNRACEWFCKTDHQPYDEVVTAILVHAILTDNGEVDTDGFYEDWERGIALYEKAVRWKLTDPQRRKLVNVLRHRQFIPVRDTEVVELH